MSDAILALSIPAAIAWAVYAFQKNSEKKTLAKRSQVANLQGNRELRTATEGVVKVTVMLMALHEVTNDSEVYVRVNRMYQRLISMKTQTSYIQDCLVSRGFRAGVVREISENYGTFKNHSVLEITVIVSAICDHFFDLGSVCNEYHNGNM